MCRVSGDYCVPAAPVRGRRAVFLDPPPSIPIGTRIRCRSPSAGLGRFFFFNSQELLKDFTEKPMNLSKCYFVQRVLQNGGI
jgi:hypothetical protein